jgi:hypothetical protein
MIRPWYRSRLFWLGLPGLLFLCWAWNHSNSTRVMTHLGPSSGWAGSGHGNFLWFRVRTQGDELIGLDLRNGQASEEPGGPEYFNSSSAKFAVSRFHTTVTSPLSPAPPWFPVPHGRAERLAAGTSLFVSLPYWLLIAGYAALWLGGLACWQRRKVRLLKRHTSPPP